MRGIDSTGFTALRLAKVLSTLVASLGLGIIAVVPPEQLPLPPCLFRELTGMPCLTCGLTRSLHAAVRGDLQEAFTFHALGPFLFAAALAGVLMVLAGAVPMRSLQDRCPPWLTRALVAVVLTAWAVHGVVRMVVSG